MRGAVEQLLITGLAQLRPVINRISPTLTGRTKIIRRDPSHGDRVTLLIHLKDRLMAPDIHTVIGDIDWNVSDDLYIFCCTIFSQSRPLLKKYKLQQLGFFNLRGIHFGELVQFFNRWPTVFYGPTTPQSSIEIVFKHHKYSVIVNPRGIIMGKTFIFGVSFPGLLKI